MGRENSTRRISASGAFAHFLPQVNYEAPYAMISPLELLKEAQPKTLVIGISVSEDPLGVRGGASSAKYGCLTWD